MGKNRCRYFLGYRYFLSSGGQTNSRGFYFANHSTGIKNGSIYGNITRFYDYEKWINLLIVWKNQGLYFYEDGLLINTKHLSVGIDDTSTILHVGKVNNNNKYYHKGLIDEIRIYDRALNENEINYIYSLNYNELNQKMENVEWLTILMQ